MPNVNPGGGGTDPTPNKYPQWGIKSDNGQTSGTWTTVEAKNAKQKNQDLNQGYLIWFNSKSKAQQAIKAQKGFASGNVGLGVDWQTVMVRVGEALLGIVLIGIGLARITGAQNVVSQVAKARIP